MANFKSFIEFTIMTKLTALNYDSITNYQEVAGILKEAIQGIEKYVDSELKDEVRPKLKLCLLQLQYSINKMSEVLNYNSGYPLKMNILRLINKKIYLCFKEVLKLNDEYTCSFTSSEMNYQLLMSEVLSLFLSTEVPMDRMNNLIDNLLCSALTIAKLSDHSDFKEISTSCKNVLNAFSSLKTESCSSNCPFNYNYILYHIKLLDKRVNTAMLKLFLHIMSYPQLMLKKMIKRCGISTSTEKFSEDLDDEICHFDLTCDRIALLGNFAIVSCDQEPLKLQVKNCLANLEFCEESLVPSCIDFYLEPNHEKRELLKYLSCEWKSEVLSLNRLLDSIVDSATFSLVIFEDLSDLIQEIKTSYPNCDETLFEHIYHRCMKFIDNIDRSPDCLSDSIIIDLKKKILSELKLNERKFSSHDNMKNKVQHLDVILGLVDQMSEHLNKIVNSSVSSFGDVSRSTLNNVSMNDSEFSKSLHEPNDYVTYDWNESQTVNNKLLLNAYLQKAYKKSPFAFTMYQKTPIRKKHRDNVALTLDISRSLLGSFDA